METLLANAKNCAVMVCNDSKVDEVDFKWKWGDEELSRLDHQYTHLGVAFCEVTEKRRPG